MLFQAIKNNRDEIIIFIILISFSSFQIFYQYSIWDTHPDKSLHEIQGLLSGDEPHYVSYTSTMIRYNSVNLYDFFQTSNPDPNFIFPSQYYGESGNCVIWHGIIASDGNCNPSHAIGLSFLILPGYFIGGIVGTMVTMSIFFALLGVLIFKFSSKFVTRRSSFITTIFLSISTGIFAFSSEIYPDLVAGFFLILSIYLFFYKKNNFFYLSIIGANLGFLIHLKIGFGIFSLILLPIMIIILIKNKTYRKNAIFLIGVFLLFTSLFIMYNQITHDSIGGHHGDISVNKLKPTLSENYAKVSMGLANYLFGQSYGLFIFSPLLLISIFGIKYFWSKNKLVAFTTISVILIFLIFHSLGVPIGGNNTIPSRYLMPVIPLFGIPLAILFEKYHRNIVFQTFLFMTSFLGVSSNIYLANIINSHPFASARADIANSIYFGGSKIFPYVDRFAGPMTKTNFWINIDPLFWVVLSALILIFFIFNTFFYVKNSIRNHNSKKKYGIIFLFSTFILIVIFGFYNINNEFQIEPRISSLFNEELLRDPSSEEITFWKNEIHKGKSFDLIRDKLRNSDEGKLTLHLEKIYSEILNRNVDTKGATHWKNEFQKGQSLDSIRDEIKKYPESITKINELYNKILHRNADYTGLIFWTNLVVIEGLSYEEIEQMIKNSPEVKNYN